MSSSTDADAAHWAAHDRRMAEHLERKDRALDQFRALCGGFLGVQRFRGQWAGGELPVFKRLLEADRARREWRNASGTRGADYEELMLAIRIVADQLASEISAAAADEQDPTTIAWVLAGLRCHLRPFCTGCTACQTITSPTRPVA